MREKGRGRRVAPAFLAMGLLALGAGCNDGGLETAPSSSPEEHPEETPDATPAPEETPETFPTPIAPPATPLPTPLPCAFYGIGSAGDLWVIDPAVPSADLVGVSNVSNTTDLAILPDGKMIVITAQAAYQVDPATAQAYPWQSAPWVQGQNSLDALPDGRLLVGGGSTVKLLGAGVPTFESLPFGAGQWSGDFAVDGDIAWGSALDNWDGNDHLIEVNLVTGTVTEKGQFSLPHVYGIDVACDGNVYAMFEGNPDEGLPPRVFRIDTNGPQVVDLGELVGPQRLWGGAGPVVAP